MVQFALLPKVKTVGYIDRFYSLGYPGVRFALLQFDFTTTKEGLQIVVFYIIDDLLLLALISKAITV